MHRDFHYVPKSDRRITVRFSAAVTYRNVLDAAAEAIERAGAGRIVNPDTDAAGVVIDAGQIWRRFSRRILRRASHEH